MEERLTEQKTRKGITKIVVKPFVDMYIVVHKLYLLEDIMEKYGIESVEELEDKIICYEENKDVNLGLKLDIKKLEQELDTWKRACELASETLKQVMGKPLWIGGNIPTPEVKDSDYFYQQAKNMEGNDE